ncbi:hypothetical protein D3C80_859670 [compost metagenome]
MVIDDRIQVVQLCGQFARLTQKETLHVGGFLQRLSVWIALLERALADDGNLSEFDQRRDVEAFAIFGQVEAVVERRSGGMVVCCVNFFLAEIRSGRDGDARGLTVLDGPETYGCTFHFVLPGVGK